MANNTIFQLVVNGTSDIFSATGLEDIKNCMSMIATTHIGTVPLYRHFGTQWQWVDRPEPYAMARFRADLIEAIEEFEPRVTVISISFKSDTSNAIQGKIFPVIKFKLADGVSL